MVRWIALSIVAAAACATQTGGGTDIHVLGSGAGPSGGGPWQCIYPDARGSDEICQCFDGDVRCNTACPADLAQACTPNTACGDLSGGSAGQDCECTCDSTGAWGCVGPSGACVPQR